MISRGAIDERVREWGLREDVVEKDYVLGWVLWGIGTQAELRDTWVFKGGTCLKKCYLETYRFSEDLDFTVMLDGPVSPADVAPIIGAMLNRVQQESGIDFSVRPSRFAERPQVGSTEGRVYFVGPRSTPSPGSVKIDLLANEKVTRPTVLRPISHPYTDQLPESGTVRCYGFEELFAEKIRAMGERLRPRDLYDVVNLFRREEFRAHGSLIRAVLIEKCEAKGISPPDLDALSKSSLLEELSAEWENMLAHQLPTLPPFSTFWDELPGVFAWLEGRAPKALLAVPVQANEESTWNPPATIWTWGTGVPFESVRFAAANRLCVELGYNGTTRLIEPYSLRRTKSGQVILHAVRHNSREARSYRIDRMQSVRVTNVPFTPIYAVEFGTAGPLSIPPTSRRQVTQVTRHRAASSASGVAYVVECSWCNKRFRRTRLVNTLRPHKDKSGWPCPGRFSYHVDTIYR